MPNSSEVELCKDGRQVASTPEKDKWYSNALAEAYSPDQMKVKSAAADQKDRMQLSWPNEITRAPAGSKVSAVGRSVVVAESGSFVSSFKDDSLVVAKQGSVVFAGCPARVVAEPGAQVVAFNGARVDAKPGATVVDSVKGDDLMDRIATRPGSNMEIASNFGNFYGDQVFVTRDSTVSTRHRNTIAQPGSQVFAQEGSTVLAEPGSKVSALRGSTVYSTPGAIVERDRGAEVIEARGYLGPQFSNKLSDISGGGQLKYTIKGVENIEAQRGQSISTDASNVVAHRGSTVEVWRPSEQSPGKVVAEGGSFASVSGNTEVTAQQESSVIVRGGAKAHALPGSSVVVQSGGKAIAESGSNVVVTYGGEVTAKAGSHIIVKTGGKAHAEKGADVVYKSWIDKARDVIF